MKPVNADNVNEARKRYQGSNEEKSDVIRELKIGKGSMTHPLNNIPFMRIEDENRMIKRVIPIVHSLTALTELNSHCRISTHRLRAIIAVCPKVTKLHVEMHSQNVLTAESILRFKETIRAQHRKKMLTITIHNHDFVATTEKDVQ